MSESTYHGSCHCGAVAYDVTFSLEGLITCNSSICQKKGTILGFTPAPNFKLLSREKNLQDYQFGSKNIHHLFCKTCGITSFARGAMPDGTEIRAINIRCLDNVDLETLTTSKVDGRSL